MSTLISSGEFRFVGYLCKAIMDSSDATVSNLTERDIATADLSRLTNDNIAPISSNFPKNKRITSASRAMNRCPAYGMPDQYMNFVGSNCGRTSNPKVIDITCERQIQRHRRRRTTAIECTGAGEMCINAHVCGIETACCVTGRTFEFVAQSQNNTPKSIRAYSISTRQRGPLMNNQNIEVILTRPDRADVLYTAHLITLLLKEADGNIAAQPAICSGCNSLTFRNMPTGTYHITIHVLLPRAGETAVVNVFVYNVRAPRH